MEKPSKKPVKHINIESNIKELPDMEEDDQNISKQ